MYVQLPSASLWRFLASDPSNRRSGYLATNSQQRYYYLRQKRYISLPRSRKVTLTLLRVPHHHCTDLAIWITSKASRASQRRQSPCRASHSWKGCWSECEAFQKMLGYHKECRSRTPKSTLPMTHCWDSHRKKLGRLPKIIRLDPL